MSDLSKAPSPLAWWRRHKLVRFIVYLILVAVIYPLSVIVLVSAYWLKTDMGYNLLKQGGWHAFSSCLAREIPVPSEKGHESK